ncbi:hypothetical protein [Fibrella aquatilis]|uniref:Uncharacterized protein n=1 Tax=Fibrella aquatilis TaxID=2817059 RepID=A0A939K123_9BACT|nr:hypothetical protein [Fibrella aquatilis]MBO0933068.1 hypothetical protein [Fibrella aquatilis]
MNRLLLLLTISLGLAQCKQPAPEPAPVDYKKEAIRVMSALKPQVVGTWVLNRVQINAQRYNMASYGAKLVADTTFQDFATITIQQPLKLWDTPEDPGAPQFSGSIRFRGKTYPLYFRTMAGYERIEKGTGYVALFTLYYNFPNGPLPNDPELRFLTTVRIEDHYSMEIGADGKTMLWKAFNNSLTQIDMRKQ